MNRTLLSILISLAGLILLMSCDKKDYLIDEGVHQSKVNLTTYDCLKQNPYHMFDTLILAIDHFNLKEEVNNAGTFFAPTDYSIHRWDFDGKIDLESLFSRMTADSLRQYMFAERIQMSDFTNDTPHIYHNLGNTSWQIAVGRQLQTDQQWNQWSGGPVYFLYLTRMVGTLDIPAGSGNDIRSKCQTQGVETTTGIVHTLENTHVFVRFK